MLLDLLTHTTMKTTWDGRRFTVYFLPYHFEVFSNCLFFLSVDKPFCAGVYRRREPFFRTFSFFIIFFLLSSKTHALTYTNTHTERIFLRFLDV